MVEFVGGEGVWVVALGEDGFAHDHCRALADGDEGSGVRWEVVWAVERQCSVPVHVFDAEGVESSVCGAWYTGVLVPCDMCLPGWAGKYCPKVGEGG